MFYDRNALFCTLPQNLRYKVQSTVQVHVQVQGRTSLTYGETRKWNVLYFCKRVVLNFFVVHFLTFYFYRLFYVFLLIIYSLRNSIKHVL